VEDGGGDGGSGGSRVGADAAWIDDTGVSSDSEETTAKVSRKESQSRNPTVETDVNVTGSKSATNDAHPTSPKQNADKRRGAEANPPTTGQ
jgi:hypothetical protein